MPSSMSTKTRAFIRDENKLAWNEKWKKQLWVFVYIKYGKFWSVSLELFIKHKPLFSEEWSDIWGDYFADNLFSYIVGVRIYPSLECSALLIVHSPRVHCWFWTLVYWSKCHHHIKGSRIEMWEFFIITTST